MVLGYLKRLPGRAALSGAALLALAGLSARGQYTAPYPPAMSWGYPAPPYRQSPPRPYGPYQQPPCYAPPFVAPMAPYGGMPSTPYQPFVLPPHPCLPGAAPPEKPTSPEEKRPEEKRPEESRPGERRPQDTLPSDQSQNQGQDQAQNQDQNQNQNNDLPGEQGSASGTGEVAYAAPGGYLDNPIPITTFRVRYDDAFGMNRPDRAEYFYGAWQELSFHPHGIQGHGVFFDPKAIGPTLLPGNVNYQQPEAYFEYAGFRNRLSGFVQVPYRYINFRDLHEDFPESEQKRNPADLPNPGSKFFPESGPENQGPPQTSYNGFSDLQFGFKGALITSPRQFLTFQLRTYTPTGNSFQGLGTGHWSVEPSLLYYLRPTKRLVFQGQLTDWTPIQGGEAGNIIEYGAGLGYTVFQRGRFAVMPITEYLGWTVLDGYQAVFEPIHANGGPGLELPQTHGVEFAGGNTIVNGKWGVRFFFGNGHSLYVGYGRALTGTHWYTDDFRLEYRLFFGRSAAAFRPL